MNKKHEVANKAWDPKDPWDEDVYLPRWMVDFYGKMSVNMIVPMDLLGCDCVAGNIFL